MLVVIQFLYLLSFGSPSKMERFNAVSAPQNYRLQNDIRIEIQFGDSMQA